MLTTLVDSNVIFDFLSEDEKWFDWSASMLEKAANEGGVAINPVIYAEVSVNFDRIEAVELVLRKDYFVRASIPWEAAFLAAKTFAIHKRQGRRDGGPASRNLIVGAHAAVTGMSLLTRDPKRYRTYFPKLKLVSP